MKKLILALIMLLFMACRNEDNNPEPIEKYKGFVVAYKSPGYSRYEKPQEYFVTLKNKDSIVYTRVLTFDAEKYEVGDTIK